MPDPLPVPQLLDEWLAWAKWISDPDRREADGQNLIGFSEFDFAVSDHPEHAWLALCAAAEDARLDPYINILATGPLEDPLSGRGPEFIERVEDRAKTNPRFASMLGGVWRLNMTDDVWSRVQAVWDRRGWDGITK